LAQFLEETSSHAKTEGPDRPQKVRRPSRLRVVSRTRDFSLGTVLAMWYHSAMGNHAGPGSLMYVARCGEFDLFKIGSAANPRARLGGIQVGCPFEITLLAVFTGGSDLEGALQGRLRKLHVRGEWYRIPGSDPIAVIETLVEELKKKSQHLADVRRVDTWSINWDVRELNDGPRYAQRYQR